MLRIANAGTRAHHVLAVRVGPRMTDRQAVAAVRNGHLHRLGYAQDLLGLVSAGTVNRVRYHLKPGRWVIASTYGALLPGAHSDAARGLVRSFASADLFRRGAGCPPRDG